MIFSVHFFIVYMYFNLTELYITDHFLWFIFAHINVIYFIQIIYLKYKFIKIL